MKIQHLQPTHSELPHVVKFSGGRSSAMMLMKLLESNQLSASRGDVIIFNNTSAEHPETYKFIVRCKKYAEQEHQIPFFLIEFQTYEDAWMGRWRRASTYRMVKPHPFSYYKNKRSFGYRQKGEVFEEFISWNAQLPNRFSRTCTEYLKLRTTAHFLEDWFGRADKSLPDKSNSQSYKTRPTSGTNLRLGHFYGESRMPKPEFYGPRAEKVRFHLEQSTVRESQKYQDYTSAPLCDIDNDIVKACVFDQKARLRGEGALQYISLVGLRVDEPVRVARTLSRNGMQDNNGRISDGEIVYAPLFDSEIDKNSVLEFWERQSFRLEIPYESNLSNCVFCFMKGGKTIRHLADNHSVGNGPTNIQWWSDLERKYSNSVISRKNKNAKTLFGFFGANSITYKDIMDGKLATKKESASSFLPCECTD